MHILVLLSEAKVQLSGGQIRNRTLLMGVVRSLIYRQISHTVLPESSTTVGLVKKSYDGLANPTMLRTRSPRVQDIAKNYTEGQGYGS